MIVLIRHAKPQKATGRFTGTTDLPLAATGKQQASLLAQHLAPHTFNALYSSPLTRARETALPLAQKTGQPVQQIKNLQEIHLGTWEGRLIEDIRQSCPQEYAARGKNFAHYAPPQGENFTQLQQRAITALTTIAQGPLPALAVTHAGIIRVLLCHLLVLPLQSAFQLRPAFAQCTVLQTDAEKITLCSFNVRADQI